MSIQLKHKWINYYLEIFDNLAVLSRKTPNTKRTLFFDNINSAYLGNLLREHNVKLEDFAVIDKPKNTI